MMGGARPAPGAIFRASRKITGALKGIETACVSDVPVAGRGAHPATPGAGVLPNSDHQTRGGSWWGRNVAQIQFLRAPASLRLR